MTVDWLTEVTAARQTGQKGAALARAVALLPRLKCSACGSRAVWLRAVVDGRQAAFEATETRAPGDSVPATAAQRLPGRLFSPPRPAP